MPNQISATEKEFLNAIETTASTYRAAEGTLEEGLTNLSTHTEPGKIDPAVSGKNVGLWEPKDLAFLDQHIFLDTEDCEDAFAFITEKLTELSDGFKNFREFPGEFKVVGYFLDETRQGCYRVQLFEYQERLGINCTRLEGDALAVSKIWSSMKQALHEAQFYRDEFLMEEAETDNEGLWSEPELDLNSFKFLELSRDPDFVAKLIDEIEDLNVGTHALMLLNFNCQKESNLDFLTREYGQTLFDTTVERISERVSLPDIVCASNLIMYMAAQAAIAVTVEQMRIILEAADQWSFESHSRKSTVPTASEQAATTLTNAITPLKKCLSGDLSTLDLEDRLRTIHEKTDFDTVQENVMALEAFN